MSPTEMYQPQKIRKLLVANRGEIAVRILRAAKELGMQTVAIYSDADKETYAAQYADEAVHIGPSIPLSKSYLNHQAIIDAALACGADAIHPGYGFLSENATFAQAVEDQGLIFVGPSAKTIQMMGDKANARACAQQAGVPIVQGSDAVADVQEACAVANKIGYPVMLKAAAGGGGKGIRVLHCEQDLLDQFPIAQSESMAAFQSNALYLEQFITNARHIEVQILGDGHHAIHLFERECSLQRRRQKILEEAPSPSLNEEQRQFLCASALKLAQFIRYSGAGTLEYLYDATRAHEASKGFYFIEMNTRIQVEHPITEAITGVDLVKEMLRIADGRPLRFKQEDIQLKGAAIECRINAENPKKKFMPSPGTIQRLFFPSGPGVRVDTFLQSGSVITAYYDSLLAKLIVHDDDRAAAIARCLRALAEIQVEGISHTTELHQALLQDPEVIAGKYHTNFLEAWLEQKGDSL